MRYRLEKQEYGACLQSVASTARSIPCHLSGATKESKERIGKEMMKHDALDGTDRVDRESQFIK